MKQSLDDAFVELTAEEEKRFISDEQFKQEVIHAADEIASQTDRTVIIAGPQKRLGTFNGSEFVPAEDGDDDPFGLFGDAAEVKHG